MSKNKYLYNSNLRRQLLIAGASWPALMLAKAAYAQPKAPVLIGWFEATARDRNINRLNAFKEGMAALGWKEGVDYVLEERWAQGRIDQLPALARELAAKKPAIIVAAPTQPAIEAAMATPRTPIVMANGNPLSTGMVKSFARPDGMLTGLTNINADMTAKLVELLRDIMPEVRRIGFLIDRTVPNLNDTMVTARKAARAYSLEVRLTEASTPEDLEPALSRLRKERVQALIPTSSAWFTGERQRIVKFALAQRWPIVASQSEYAEAGALAAYGADRVALYRRAAYYVDRILKGAKPGDLPIEQPTTFELLLNIRTAKFLDLVIPQVVLVRATKVIG